MEKVGVRDLKNRPSEYLRRVAAIRSLDALHLANLLDLARDVPGIGLLSLDDRVALGLQVLP